VEEERDGRWMGGRHVSSWQCRIHGLPLPAEATLPPSHIVAYCTASSRTPSRRTPYAMRSPAVLALVLALFAACALAWNKEGAPHPPCAPRPCC